jgi:hypothetical protein
MKRNEASSEKGTGFFINGFNLDYFAKRNRKDTQRSAIMLH